MSTQLASREKFLQRKKEKYKTSVSIFMVYFY